MLTLKKILFLIKSKASLKIILIFFKTKILNIFVKKKMKERKKENVVFLKNKNITTDYFSSHAYNFYEILKKFNKFNYLEIGSFEGNSAMFVARNFLNSKIYCVDNWQGDEEYYNLEFLKIEENFDKNIFEFKNILKFKILSDDFFNNNKIKFDVIYIDGYHKGSQVFKDFKNSWQILNVGGILIFDDYIWKFFLKIEDNPCYVINKYINEISKNIKILKVSNSQLFVQKTG
jgi:predicted O-methyltransferase YrrM